MRLIDAERLTEQLMKFIVSGYANDPSDCAEFNSMIEEAPTVEMYRQPFTGEWEEGGEECMTCPDCGTQIFKPYIIEARTVMRYRPNRCPFCGRIFR